MPDKPFSAWSEALRLLNDCFRDSKDKRDRALLMANIAQIELLREMNRKLDRLPLLILPAEKVP